MPNTNGATLTAVKATKTGGTIQEEVLPSDAGFQIAVQAEVGQALFNTGGSFKIQMVLTDLSTSTITKTANTSGRFGSGREWQNLSWEFRFAIPTLGSTADDHVFRAFAVLQTGDQDPIIDFEEGDIFVIAHP